MTRLYFWCLCFLAACKFPEPPPVDHDAASVDAATSDGPPSQFTLTVITDGPGVVSSQPAGISCVANTCMMTYAAGQEVELTATPDSESSFVGFSGACSGSVPSCTVAMSADRTVMASFRAFECEPNTTTCTQQTLVECDANGVADARLCPLGCHPSGARCYDLDPTNVGMRECLDEAAVEVDATIPDGATINTDNGSITLSGGGTLNVPSAAISAPANGVPVRCFRANNLTIGNVTVIGAPALAIAANGAVTVTGHLSVSARGFDTPGPGHLSTPTNCNGGNLTAGGLVLGGGGGGGGFGGAGGRGGGGGNGSVGGAQGPINGNAELVPLRGGCSGGGHEQMGMTIRLNAGGALHLVSRVGITFSAGAGVSANGWGGGSTQALITINRGGGSGGAILLEAPVVTLPSSAFLVANGGGGGGIEPGMPADISTMGGAGGPAGMVDTDPFGAGGRGGGLVSNAAFGESTSGRGGGGGGGVGRIRVLAYSVFVPDVGAMVSPMPATGSPGRR